MKVHAKEKKKCAIEMRKQGKSYGEIGKDLNIAKSTLSYWLKEISLSKEHKARFYTERIKNMAIGPNSVRERRQREIDAIVNAAKAEIKLPLSRDAYRLLGAALYWAEGTKTGGMTVTNSDPLLILFMVRWINEVFSIHPAQLKAWLNIYPQQNDSELKKFWSSLLDIPVSQFGKSFVKPLSKGYKKNTLYYGTIKVYIPKSTNLKHKVFGWIQSVLSTYGAEYTFVVRKWEKLRIEKAVNLD